MLFGGDIYELPYENINTIFKNHSRVARKKGRSNQALSNSSSSTTSIKNEIGNMLEDFKSEILHTFSLQMDTMQIKRRQEEAKRALAIFFPKCTRRHPRNECPLNVIEVCSVCEANHSKDKFPLTRLKVVYQGAEGGAEQLFYQSKEASRTSAILAGHARCILLLLPSQLECIPATLVFFYSSFMFHTLVLCTSVSSPIC